ncbi:MAG: hypothetical protein J5493_00895 [Lachnospiraceae bacterium]|nr:hypothetical protein [Lachnospiraceae bacterium]
MHKKLVRLSVFLICLISLALPAAVHAVGPGQGIGVYHKPAVTIAVLHASPGAEMKITMFHQLKGGSFEVTPKREQRGWEVCFRLYRGDVFHLNAWYGNAYDFKDAYVTIQDRGRTVTIPVPYADLKESSYDDLLILDMNKETLTAGVPWTRTAALLLMHLGIYLLAEGAIFWIMGVRERASWRTFIIYTVISKGLWCWFIHDWLNVDPRSYVFFAVMAVLAIVLDLAVYLLTIDESKDLLSKFAALSNIAAALAIFGALELLPVAS